MIDQTQLRVIAFTEAMHHADINATHLGIQTSPETVIADSKKYFALLDGEESDVEARDTSADPGPGSCH